MPKKSTNGHWVYSAYITVKGKRIYPKNAKCFKFWVTSDKK